MDTMTKQTIHLVKLLRTLISDCTSDGLNKNVAIRVFPYR